VIAGVVSYMLLCWGGGGLGIGKSDISLFFGTFCSRRGVGLSPGFCYVCVSVTSDTRQDKFEELVGLVGFTRIIRIYHDARSPEREIQEMCLLFVRTESLNTTDINFRLQTDNDTI